MLDSFAKLSLSLSLVALTSVVASPSRAGDDAPAAPPGPDSEPSAPAVAERPPELTDAQKADAWLKRLLGSADRPEIEAALVLLGFEAGDRALVHGGNVVDARRRVVNLDNDAAQEWVVELDVDAQAPDMGGAKKIYLLAFVDQGSSAGVVAGRRAYSIGSCIVDGSLSFTFEPVHEAGYNDVAIYWEDASSCNGNPSSASGVDLYSMARGQLDQLLAFKDYSMIDRRSGTVIDPKQTVLFEGAHPKAATVREGNRIVKRLRFDAAQYVYR